MECRNTVITSCSRSLPINASQFEFSWNFFFNIVTPSPLLCFSVFSYQVYMLRVGLRGAMTPLPHTSPRRSAYVISHGDNFITSLVTFSVIAWCWYRGFVFVVECKITAWLSREISVYRLDNVIFRWCTSGVSNTRCPAVQNAALKLLGFILKYIKTLI
jgi:hypothetical protein